MMTPITRIEHYLAKMNGEDVQIPAPITRKELYLAKICGEDVEVPEPVTIDEKFLYALAGGEANLPKPITRLQHAMAIRLGIDDTEIIPITREEYFWLADGGPSATVKGFAPLTLLNALAKKIKSLVQYGKCTVSGTDITCNNGVLKYGVGKNKFDVSKVQTRTNPNGGKITNNGDGTITINTPSSQSNVESYQSLKDIAKLTVGETYTLTANSTGSTKIIYLYTSRESWAFGTSRTITQDDLDSMVFFYASGSGTEAVISDMMIRLSSVTDPTFEPYTEGFYTEGTPEEIRVTASGADDQTATASSLFAVGSIADEQDIISGAITRRCEAVVSDGTTPSGRYIGTVGEGNILVCAKETGYSGAIASFTADKAEPLSGLVAEINPVQDLHGQDAPYPAGCGVNKLPYAESGTATNNGITFKSNGDGTYLITGTTGAESANPYFDLLGEYTIQDGDYIHLMNSVANSGVQLSLDKAGTGNIDYWTMSTANRIAAISGSKTGQTVSRLRMYVAANTSDVNITVKPMICKSSTAISFAPYSNICPISGWTGLEGQRTGFNVWDEEWENGTFNTTTGANIVNANQIRSKNYVPIKSEQSYYFKTPKGLWVLFFDKDKNPVNSGASSSFAKDGNSVQLGADASHAVFSPPAGACFFRFYCQGSYGSTYNNDISINYPSTDTSYHAYTGEAISVTFPSTIYGGTDEVVSGNGTSTMAIVDLGDLTWTYYSSAASPGHERFVSNAVSPTAKVAPGSTLANALCSSYKLATSNQVYSHSSDSIFCVDGDKFLMRVLASALRGNI